jgi:hypothetical protein
MQRRDSRGQQMNDDGADAFVPLLFDHHGPQVVERCIM